MKARRVQERGAASIIVAIVVVVLFGFTALSIDVFRLYEERRELQRTADVVALSGAQAFVSGDAALARSTAQGYVAENETVHHKGDYSGPSDPDPYPCTSDPNHDCVDATSAKCEVQGYEALFDCVEARVVAPPQSLDSEHGFRFFFASILGFDERAISAEATAVLGAGAPTGGPLVPWAIPDCPLPEKYADESAIDPASIYKNTCPYDYANSWDDPRDILYLANDDPGKDGGNHQALAFHEDPACAQSIWGLFDEGKSGDYDEFMSGALLDPCTMSPGARVETLPGERTGPTILHGFDNRVTKDNKCLYGNEEERIDIFNNTIDPLSDGSVRILDPENKCLVLLPLYVRPDPDSVADEDNGPPLNSAGNVDPDTWINQLQESDPQLRLTPIDGGRQIILIRRYAFFYVTQPAASPNENFQGIFLKATLSAEAELSGGSCDPSDGLCVVKLIK